MIKTGRKAMMDDFFDFMFTVIAGFFILLFLVLVLNGAAEGKKEEAVRNIGHFNSEENLITYLRSSVDGGEMADLIRRWYYHREQLEDQLVQESEQLLKTFPAPRTHAGWNVRIYSPENKELLHIVTYNILGWYENRNYAAGLDIEEGSLKIEIYLECQDDVCK